jgi:hypothetical protein
MTTKDQARRVTLGPNDMAIVLREDGDLELVVPDRGDDEDVPGDQFALMAFADAFNDSRLRNLLGQIWEETERRRLPS